MDNAVKKAEASAKRIIVSIDPKDQAAVALYNKLSEAAKKDRRELGDFVLIHLLNSTVPE
jgi:hypothetical protein